MTRMQPHLKSILTILARCGFVAGALFGCGASQADIPLEASAPLHIRNWQAQDGLPSNKVTAVVQTEDGYIWVGTYEGLARFDGAEFERIGADRFEGASDMSVSALVASPDGSLWIGNTDGAVSHYRNGHFTRYEASLENRGTSVHSIAVDASGDAWSINEEGVLSRVRDGLELRPESGESRGLFSLATTTDGELWINCRAKLSRLRNGELETVPLTPEMEYYVHGFAASPSGGVWVVAGESLWKYQAEEWHGPFGRLATGYAPAYELRELSSGQLVAGTSENGALLLSASPFEQRRLWRETAFPSDWIFATFEDREGGLWLATGTAGLFRIAQNEVRLMRPEDGWGGRTPLSVMESTAGELWVSTEGGGVYRFHEGRWSHFAQEEGIGNPYVWSVREAPDGRVLLGTWGNGLFEKRGNRFVRAKGMEGLELAVSAIAPSAFGGVLIGCQQGVLRYEDGEVVWLEEDPDRRQVRDARFILEDDDGTVWVACDGEGLGRIAGQEVRVYSRKDGLSSNYLRCLFRASDGALWIGTRGAGLVRFRDGRFVSVSREHGLLADTISHIEEDAQGNLWIGTLSGIMRLPLAELNACADGETDRVNPLRFGRGAGSPSLVCSGPLQPAGTRLDGGDIIFATASGVARIDPDSVAINPIAPPVEIQSIRVGNRLVYDGGGDLGRIVAQPGENRLEIEYAGLSFDAPEDVQFRRRLSGRSTEWVDTDRERSAVYSFVPPGEYAFQVTAANADNVWNQRGASVVLVFEPYFWQTAWFRGGVLLAIIGAASAVVWQLSRSRHRKELEQIERSRALEQERARIANDMHDDLGAHLTRITMLSENARSEKADMQRVMSGLGMIYDTAKSVTLAMDEIVWAVNPRHDSFESLIAYFEKFAQDLLASAGMRCRLEMPLEPSSWRPNSEVRHNLFLAYKEALNNAVRHSGGDEVTVSVELAPPWCRVTVSDNGRGLSEEHEGPSAAPNRIATGTGLTSMRERMARIGGELALRTSKTGGLAVELRAPAAVDDGEKSRRRLRTGQSAS